MRELTEGSCILNETNAPDELIVVADIDKNTSLNKGKSQVNMTSCTYKHCLNESSTCHRCKLNLSRKDSISASITHDCGCQVTYFICAACIIDLQALD